MRLRKFERVAYHEAGHAVTAVRLDIALESVTIVPKVGEYLGLTKNPLPNWFKKELATESLTLKGENYLARHVLLSLAGSAAEKAFCGRCLHQGAERDYNTAADIALRFWGNEEMATAYLKWMSVRIKTLMQSPFYQCAVPAVAEALLARKTLTAGEVKQAMDSIFSNRFPVPKIHYTDKSQAQMQPVLADPDRYDLTTLPTASAFDE